MTGALFMDIVNGVRAPREKTEVSDFVRKAQVGFERVCPAYRARTIALPPRPLPARNALDLLFSKDSRRNDGSTLPEREILEAFLKESDSREVQMQRFVDAEIDARQQLIEEAQLCVCQAIANEEFGPSVICPRD